MTRWAMRFPNAATWPATAAAVMAMLSDPRWTTAWTVAAVSFTIATLLPERRNDGPRP